MKQIKLFIIAYVFESSDSDRRTCNETLTSRRFTVQYDSDKFSLLLLYSQSVRKKNTKKIKPSLYSPKYAEACNKFVGPSPRVVTNSFAVQGEFLMTILFIPGVANLWRMRQTWRIA